MTHEAPSFRTVGDALKLYDEAWSSFTGTVPPPDPEAFAAWIASLPWLAYADMVAAVVAYCAAVSGSPNKALSLLARKFRPGSAVAIGFRTFRRGRTAAPFSFASALLRLHLTGGQRMAAMAVYCALLGVEDPGVLLVLVAVSREDTPHLVFSDEPQDISDPLEEFSL